ncbi:hypothetical protein Aph01nite_42120 [Acrocarpospora phusangensis]|uniref:histidine kinase n=1 Tax=Acrocarpospora phusangensis TaxID=1070424 RepID=A0A919QGQ0_9ACTN|nr:HAMP domain-containing sensor histidine kinase [Acrocarpospora phusangensis]GIH25902.1 hypothetical protein Aph01nite_42120 [Acrocarpospora phusangensis]
MTIIHSPRSIRGRCTAAISLLALIVLSVLGTTVCLPVRYALGADPYTQSDHVAGLLRGHNLEYLIAALILVLTAGTGLFTWWAIGAALRPIQSIRAHMDKINANDLGRRMPVPPGDDEIAELARTANHTLARLHETVARQRRFAATASHELRNPIAGLRAELEDALEHPEDTDPQRALRTALNTTDRLDTIVTDLLAQARMNPAGPDSHALIDLTELLTQETARMNRTHTHSPRPTSTGVEPLARANGPNGDFRGVPVRLHTQGDVWICGSRIQLIRAVTNLVSNARRHAGSAVDLTLGTEHGQAVIEVTDDGPGIPIADRQRVFERFTRLDDARRLDSGGSGLGLPITRDIAHHHHGTLTLEDSLVGARFVLRIPQLDPPAAPRYEPALPIADPPQSKVKYPAKLAEQM